MMEEEDEDQGARGQLQSKQYPLASNLKVIRSLAEFTLQQARDPKSATKNIVSFLNGLLQEEIND